MKFKVGAATHIVFKEPHPVEVDNSVLNSIIDCLVPSYLSCVRTFTILLLGSDFPNLPLFRHEARRAIPFLLKHRTFGCSY